MLLQARAIENQCFVLGVNRVGEGYGLVYPASSIGFSPLLVRLEEGAWKDGLESLVYVEVDRDSAENCRREFPMKLDRREDVYYC